MSESVNQEFQRILSNPENEIISESLKSRLSPALNTAEFSVTFGDESFECALDSFSIDPALGLTRLSLLVGPEPVGSLLSGKEFIINCTAPDIYITSKDLGSIDCFKYNNDAYVLELSVVKQGVLND